MNPTDVAQVMLNDLLLIHAACGDHKAFVALASKHAPRVFAIARNLSSSDAEALDLAERAFTRAWDEIAAMPAQLSFLAFVSRFVVRDAVQKLRDASAARSQRFFAPFDADERQLELGVPAPPAELRRIPNIDERIREAAEQLEPEDRAAFVLRVVEDLPVEEAAAIQETTVASVRARVHQASLLLAAYVQHLLAESTTVEPPLLATWIH